MHTHLALLLYLFPPLHIHVVWVSIIAWCQIFTSSATQGFLSSLPSLCFLSPPLHLPSLHAVYEFCSMAYNVFFIRAHR